MTIPTPVAPPLPAKPTLNPMAQNHLDRIKADAASRKDLPAQPRKDGR